MSPSVCFTVIIALAQIPAPIQPTNTKPGGAGDLVSQLAKSCACFNRIAMTVKCKQEPDPAGGKRPHITEVRFRQDGERVEWIGERQVLDKNGEPISGLKFGLRETMTGKRWLSANGTEGILTAELFDVSKGDRNLFLDSPDRGSPLWGRVYGNNHLSVANLLALAPDLALLSRSETVNGKDCRVLVGTTEYGKVAAWISPEAGDCAVRWSISKSPTNMFDGKPLSDQGLSSWTAEFEATDLVAAEGCFLPIRGRFTLTIRKADGFQDVVHNEYQVTDVQVNPDFKGINAFSLDLPEGTKLQIESAPGILFEWRGGKAVPVVDQAALSQIDKSVDEFLSGDPNTGSSPPRPGGSSRDLGVSPGGVAQELHAERLHPWIIAFAFGLLLVAAGAAWLLIRTRKTGRKPQ